VSDPDVAEAITAAARTMHHNHSVEETLQAIVDTAVRSIPGFDHIGISTIDRHGNVRTRAATDSIVWDLDTVQYELGDGPCMDALREAEVVVVPDIKHEQRWNGYVERAVKRGLRSQLAVKLYLDDDGTLGGLNMYSTSREDIDPHAQPLAQLFAAHAAIALGKAQEISELNTALHSRKMIGQALGILMERYAIDEDRAFAFLVRASSHGNVKLRDVAQELVDDRNARSRAECES
jgi:GAF domain-containing protein